MASHELSPVGVILLGYLSRSPHRYNAVQLAGVTGIPLATVQLAVDELALAGRVRIASVGGILLLPTGETDGVGPASGRRKHEEQTRHEILVMLAVGTKDEAIARKLEVSTRTVRRAVASLMEECNAESRFQLAVAAVRLGWLTATDLAQAAQHDED
jgi:DNA-binding NarL/FixJ family response regulator